MKLHTIHTDSCSRLPAELRTLLREAVSPASFDSIDLSARTTAYPYSLYFIDAVIKSQVLGEAGSNRLGSLLGAGLSKLQSMTTPNISNDTAPMLAIMAPQSSVDSVRQLVANAARVPNILDDQNWLSEFFAAFGIDDPQDQDNIINQLEADAGVTPNEPQPARPTATQPAAAQPAAAQPAAAQPAATQPAAAQPAGLQQLSGAIGAEKTATQNSINNIKATLDLIATNRVNAQQELAKINAKIKALMARMATQTPPSVATATESILNHIAGQLFDESVVQRNLYVIIPESLRQFGQAHGVTVVITEANWGQLGQKIGGFFKKIPGMVGNAIRGGASALRGMRHLAANPQYSTRKLGQWQSQSDSTRLAKYAVQLAVDHIQQKFTTTLQQAGLDPAETLALYPQWQKLKQQNDASPQFVEMSQKLDAAYKLFNRDQSPFLNWTTQEV